MIQRLEVIANGMIIVTCLAVLSIFAMQFGASRRQGAEQPRNQFVKAGEQFEALDDLRVSDSDLTLIMLLSADCKYCVQSTPFYKRLSDAVKRTNPGQAQLIVVTRDTKEAAEAFVAAYELSVAQVLAASAKQQTMLRVPGTPSLILVNRSRLVKKAWFGMLQSSTEDEVISALLGRASAT